MIYNGSIATVLSYIWEWTLILLSCCIPVLQKINEQLHFETSQHQPLAWTDLEHQTCIYSYSYKYLNVWNKNKCPYFVVNKMHIWMFCGIMLPCMWIIIQSTWFKKLACQNEYSNLPWQKKWIFQICHGKKCIF